MNSEDFIYVPAAQKSDLNDIITRVQAEKEKKDTATNDDPAAVLEEALKKLDVNAQISAQVTSLKAELEEKKKSD